MVLTIRTDKPESEIGLFDDSGAEIVYKKWHAHRELSSTILIKIDEILASQNVSYKDLKGLIFYKGPGSFTGLRIGASVANSIIYSHNLFCAGTMGDDWIGLGLMQVKEGKKEIILPEYGAPPHITQQKK